jgi:hypothetical protein
MKVAEDCGSRYCRQNKKVETMTKNIGRIHSFKKAVANMDLRKIEGLLPYYSRYYC